MTKATLIALGMTLFPIFDVPVFWPILLLYFLALLFFTTRRQVAHMIKHRYVPWSAPKQQYGDSAPAGKGAARKAPKGKRAAD